MVPIWLIVLILLLGAWSVLVILLDQKKVLDRYKMSRIWGIFLMWRTEKGKDLIDRMARPRRFWNRFSVAGLGILYFGMVSMFLLIFASTLTVLIFGFTETVSAEKVFVLPGLNPYVPLVYGMIALVFAVVIHEFSHGILTRANKMDVKSLGLLFLVVPVGAFMEPDEEQVKRVGRLKRIKMYAAGPIINFIFAFVFFVLFSSVMMGSISAPRDPFIVTNVFEGSSLEYSDVDIESLYSINGTRITSSEDIMGYSNLEPGSWVHLEVNDGDAVVNIPAIAGVMVYSVSEDSPADEAGFEKGAIIYSIDGYVVRSRDSLTDLLEETEAGQNVSVVLLEPARNGTGSVVMDRTPPVWLTADLTSGADTAFPSYGPRKVNVTLDDKYDYIHINEYKGKGFLGVGSAYLGIMGVGGDELLDRIKSPVTSADSVGEAFSNLIYMTFALPLSTTIVPFHHPLTSVYEVHGPLSVLPEGLFWFLSNCIFYLFWLNILLALFNALPAYPLDGGVIFKDSIVLIGLNFGSKDKARIERLEKTAGRIATASSFAVFGLILITWLYPYLRLFMG